MCGNSSAARASAFQAEGRGFESRFPLHAPNGEPGGGAPPGPFASQIPGRRRKSRNIPSLRLTTGVSVARFPVSRNTPDDLRESGSPSGWCVFSAHIRTHPGSFEPSHIGRYTTRRSASEPCCPLGMLTVVRAHVAQSVEHLHGKEKVIGSIPIVGSTRTSAARDGRAGAAENVGQSLNPGSP